MEILRTRKAGGGGSGREGGEVMMMAGAATEWEWGWGRFCSVQLSALYLPRRYACSGGGWLCDALLCCDSCPAASLAPANAELAHFGMDDEEDATLSPGCALVLVDNYGLS